MLQIPLSNLSRNTYWDLIEESAKQIFYTKLWGIKLVVVI